MAEVPNTKENEEDQELDEDEAQKLEQEKQQAEQLGVEAQRKANDKQELQRANKNPGACRMTDDQLRKLDSSVKKNSTFVRKLRSLSEQQRNSLTSDIKSLNLSKYIQETAVSIAEAKLKLADVGCAVYVCSELHQRYDEFSSHLLDHLQKIYSTGIGKDEDKSAVTSKYRTGLRLLGELVLAGVVDEGVGLSLLNDMLTAVMKIDGKGHPYLAVVVSFARHCVEDLAGIAPRKQRLLLTKYKIRPPKSELIPAAKQAEFLELFRKYFKSVRDHLVAEHKAMHKRERRNRDIIFSKGELSEERQAENEAAQKAYDKLLTSTSTLAEVLDEDMPDLPEYKAPEDTDISIELQIPTVGAEGQEADPNSLWEDEDARSFYENITDITPFVPAILFESKKKRSSETTEGEGASEQAADGESTSKGTKEGGAAVDCVSSNGNDGESETIEEQDEEQLLEQMIKDTEAMALEEDLSGPPPEDPEEEGGEATEPSVGALFEDYLQRLPRLMNRKFVDEFAVEFCMSWNTKLNRRKLAKALFSVERNRMDLVPFYARLATTLHQCLDDITPLLIEMLIKDFRFQVYKKDQTRIDSKLKNVRFIAELTKFGMCAKNEAMKCITILLHNFTHHNLEMACLFMEQCGRFLLRSPDSHLRAKALLQIMIRKKQVQHLDPRQVRLVENALYYANPPETRQITHERLPPLHEYIRKLLYKDLTKVNTEKILRQMRKLPWGNVEVCQWAVTGLIQIWNVKYNNVHCMANLVAGLKSYQEEACLRVVDGVLEDIRVGLELNFPKLNQRRVSTLKFLGELYNYQLVESNVIFRTLYMLLSFGANPDGSPSPLDHPDSYFRVRLICLLLDTCGIYFDRGSAKKRLDAFLVFFQCYLFSKRQPLPLEVEHLVQDCVEQLRPELEMYKTPQEAHEAALKLEAKFKNKVGHTQDMEEEIEEEDDDRRGEHVPPEEENEEEDKYSVTENDSYSVADGEDESSNVNTIEAFEDEAVITEGPKLISCAEDDDFMSTLDKLMTDDSTTMGLKTGHVDAAIPLHLKGGGGRKPTAPLIREEGELKMSFKLMTKKGHKQQLKQLNIPLDSGLAVGLMEGREARQDEHKQMKELVLNYERRQEEEAYQAMITDTSTKFPTKIKTPENEFFSVKKPPSSSSMRQQQPSSNAQQPNPHKEYTNPRREQRSHDGRGQSGDYRRGRGRGRGRGAGGRGGGQRNYHDQKRREQDYQT